MTDTPNYDCRATLNVFTDPQADGFMRGGPIYDGTLRGALVRFSSLPLERQHTASIGIDVENSWNDKTLLDASDIREIFLRSDCPR
jgi:hypothetical protein